MASFWLEYTQDGQRREFSFDSTTVTVGRDKSADFVLDHPTVSRQHAMIRADHGGCQLVVLSQGGLTAIDGGQVTGEVPLYDGSEIHFGQLSFVFRSHTAARKPVAPAAGLGGGIVHAPPSPAPAPTPTGGNTGWGSTNWDDVGPSTSSPSAPAPAPASDAIVTWDQIAASADAQEAANDRATDFQRIQAAQAKADAQSKGNNPLIIYGGTIGIIAMLVWAFWPRSAPPINTDVDVDNAEAPFIAWEKADIDCVGKANCESQALAAYKLGKSLAEQAGADITNPYNAYKQFDRAQKLLEKGGIAELPPEMSDVVARQTKVKAELDTKFNQARVNFLNFRTRKMYRQMADELTKVQAYFPDKRSLYNQWAVDRERKMKDDGVYPAPVLY